MRSASTWFRRAVSVAVVAIVGLTVLRFLRTSGVEDRVAPVIGGDTWPPVPVKNARTA